MVTPEVDTEIWSDAALLEGGRRVCEQLDSTNGDKDAVAGMLMSGMPSESPAVLDAWMRDVSAIEAGAVLYFCPEWEGVYE